MRKLPAGCRLESSTSGEPKVVRYWSLLDHVARPITGDDASIETELESLLSSAFSIAWLGTFPSACFVGVDSSRRRHVGAGVVAAASRPSRSVSKKTTATSSAWARKSPTIWARSTRSTFSACAKRWKWHATGGVLFDEPFGDASGLPTLLVSRLARAEVKVALSADGGDELFMGYSVYDDVIGRLDTLARVPSWVRTASAHLLSHTHVDGARRRRSLDFGTSAATRGLIVRRIRRARAIMPDASPARVYDAAISYFLPEEVGEIIGGYTNPRALADAYAGEPLEQMCLWDFHNYLPEDVLTKADRTTMAVSLEGREPMLDHRLAEFAFRLPVGCVAVRSDPSTS